MAPAEQFITANFTGNVYNIFQLVSGKLHITEQGDFISWLHTQVPNTLHRIQGARWETRISLDFLLKAFHIPVQCFGIISVSFWGGGDGTQAQLTVGSWCDSFRCAWKAPGCYQRQGKILTLHDHSRQGTTLIETPAEKLLYWRCSWWWKFSHKPKYT